MKLVKKEVDKFMANKYNSSVPKLKLHSIQKQIIRHQIQRKHKYRNDIVTTSKLECCNTPLQTNVKHNDKGTTQNSLSIIDHDKQTTTLDVSDNEISFVLSSSFITEIEELIEQPLNQSTVCMDKQSSIHHSKPINDDKVITNYEYLCSLKKSRSIKNITFSPIESILYIQIPMIFCKKVQIPIHRNVDLSSQIDKYLCIKCSPVQVYMIPNLGS